jgi:hypothetical protein
MIHEAKKLGKPQVKQDDTLTFDFFLETAVIVTKYVTKFTWEQLCKRANERREL